MPQESTPPSDLQRITTIGDSVFAFALTLLAVGVRVPSDLVGKGVSLAQVRPFLLDMGAVALSFCVASVFWIGHWVYLKQVRRTSVPFLIASLAVLLCLVLLPISTRLLSAGPLTTVSAAVYSGNLLATSISEFCFRRLAIALAVPVGAAIPKRKLSRLFAGYVGIAVHAAGLVAAFINPWISMSIWIGAFLIPLVDFLVQRSHGAIGELRPES